MQPKHLHELDALRGIAAVAVALVFHQHYLSGQYRTGPLDGLQPFTWLHDYGWTMVDLFFVLSGYIFSYVYLRRDVMSASVREFTVARVARLYPLHIATLLASAALLSLNIPEIYRRLWQEPDAWHFALNVLMLHRSGLESDLSFNVPSWSIAIEVYCYAAFYYITRRMPRWLVPLSVAIVFIGIAATAGETGSLEHIARGFCGFFAGVLTYQVRDRKVPLLLLLALATLPLFVLYRQDIVSDGALLAVTTFPAWILLSRDLRILRARPLQWLGDRSYSIYLVHAPVYWSVSIFIFDGAAVPENQRATALAASAVLILVVSDLSFRFFEAPARRVIRRWAS